MLSGDNIIENEVHLTTDRKPKECIQKKVFVSLQFNAEAGPVDIDKYQFILVWVSCLSFCRG